MNARMIGEAIARAAVVFALATVVLGVAYPFTVGAVGQLAFPWQANGSIIEVDGVKYGSQLVGQPFSDMKHLWGRPTVADATAFQGEDGQPLLWYAPENLSPASDEFAQLVQQRAEAIRAAHPDQGDTPVPSDLVTVSGSGFDPHISPAAAEYQVGRIAKATGRAPEEVRAIIRQCTEKPLLGAIGQERVNVLEVNLMLDGVLETVPNR